MTWRERLRYIVVNSGSTQAEIARRAGIAPETLSRVLNGAHSKPAFATVVRIARAARVHVGWLLDEPVRGIELSERERETIRAAGVILLDAISRSDRR
ncbi:MAG TPA: helix-turn-helix transcriptional regulator [Thermoanaerobaculia bacterium]|jgi:transcriptional regulator with XRE-family HTH domain|nr:helix-turn-helix transcriptional regulator [Thermoanaerobaculia bacterium]